MREKSSLVVLTDGANGFTHPTNKDVGGLTSYVDGGDRIVRRFLMSMADVHTTYRWLLSKQVPVVRLPDAVRGRQRFEGPVRLLVDGAAGAATPPRLPTHD